MMFPPSATSVAALSTASKRRLRSSDLGAAGYGFGPPNLVPQNIMNFHEKRDTMNGHLFNS